MFANNSNRKEEFSIENSDFNVDFSKNRIDATTMKLLVDLANEVDLKVAISSYFGGSKINFESIVSYQAIPLSEYIIL